MKRNGSKSVVSVIAAAVIALLAAGCVTVPSGDSPKTKLKSTRVPKKGQVRSADSSAL